MACGTFVHESKQAPHVSRPPSPARPPIPHDWARPLNRESRFRHDWSHLFPFQKQLYETDLPFEEEALRVNALLNDLLN